MSDLVRVRDGGVEFTVSAPYAEAQGLKVVDTPAVDQSGRALRSKPVRPAAKATESKKENPR